MIKSLYNKNYILFIFVGILLCIPILMPYFKVGYFPTHDGEWAVVRAGEMFREIRDFQFPPRYSGALNFGYGYPLFNFVYPFPYYLSTAVHLFGFGFIDSIKLIFSVSVLLSFLGMFILSKKIWGNNIAGFLSGVLYVYLPYHLVDLFVRGSIGEAISFALYPFILYSLILIFNVRTRNFGIIFAAFLISLLIVSHNISAVYFLILYLLIFVFVFAFISKKTTFFLLIPVIWGGFISFYFWGPAILEKKNILLSMIPIADRNLYFVSFKNLLYSPWGYGTPTDNKPFTYSIGIPQLLALILSFLILLKHKEIIKNKIILPIIFSLFIFIFMLFPYSSFLWKLPLLSEINYPWTLLLPIGFIISLLSGAVSKYKFGVIISVFLIIFSLFLYLPYARPSIYNSNNDLYYLTNEATTTSSNELMPLWVKKHPAKRFNEKIEGGRVSSLIYKSNEISFNVDVNKKANITVNQIYYPGWKAYVNGKKSRINYQNKMGVMSLNVPKGKNYVLLKFSNTPFRLFTEIISATSFVILLSFLTLYGFKKYV